MSIEDLERDAVRPDFLKREDVENPDAKDNRPSGDSSDPRTEALSPDQLENREKNPAQLTDQVGKGFNAISSATPVGRLKTIVGFLKKRRTLVGGGAGLGLIGIIIALFIMILPLKIEHIVQRLEKRFYASSKNAVENETQTMFERYIVKKVLPAYKKCGTTIDKNCSVAKSPLTNPVSNLYNTWAENKFETKLAENHGIEFKMTGDGKWHIKTSATTGDGIDIGKDGENLDNVFKTATRGEVRQAVMDETKWYNIMIRYKMGRLLETKYGIKRCVLFCGVKDSFADKKQESRNAIKLMLTQRILMPREQSLGIAIECILSGCDPTKTTANGDPDTPSDNGAPKDAEVDKPVSDELRKLAQSYGVIDDATLKLIQEAYDGMSKEGIQKYLLKKGLTKIGVSTVTQEVASKSIPVIGWANLAAKIISTGDNAGPTIKKLRYVTNAAAAAQLFSLYMTYADEIHTGNISATQVGSVVDSLGPGGNLKNPNDPKIGGNASAEDSPLYSDLFSTNQNKTAFMNIFNPSAYAATDQGATTDPSYICNNGKPVASGKSVCDEEYLGGGSSMANNIHEALNAPGMNIVTIAANAWRHTVGTATDWASSALTPLANAANALCNIPGSSYVNPYCILKDKIEDAIPKITELITQYLIPNPFGTNMSGGRTFNMMAAGADVSGNNFAHNGIGGKALTDQEVASILNEEDIKNTQDIANSSLKERLFASDKDYSLISQIALAIPSDLKSNLGRQLTSYSNYNIGHSISAIGSIFTPKAFAANIAQPDPFGVQQYGYTKADLDKIGDPETYWEQNCSDDSSQGYQKDNSYNLEAVGTTDEATAMPKNTTTNPCALIIATTGSAGAKYNTDLLTEDEKLIGVSAGSQQTSSVEPPDTINGRKLTNNEKQNLKFIKENVLNKLEGESDAQATVAAESSWWSLREGVLNISQPEVFKYSNCHFASGDQHIGPLESCSGIWQVGISGVQVPNFSDSKVESVAKARHSGQDIADILGALSDLGNFGDKNAVVNSTGILRRSLLMRDPATGITLVNENVRNECLSGSPKVWCISAGNPISKDRPAIDAAIAELKSYFLSTSSSGASGDSTKPIQPLNADSTDIACPNQTPLLGQMDIYINGAKRKANLCSLPNVPCSNEECAGRYGVPGNPNGHAIINSRAAGAWYALVEAAKKDGVTITTNSSLRTDAHQRELCMGTSHTVLSNGMCHSTDPYIASQGYSPHEGGYAMDIPEAGGIKGSGDSCSGRANGGTPAYNWLRANAIKFGIYQYSGESWHWDTNPANMSNRC